ncbi:nucleotidyltransferase family protein [Desulfosporosinus nitroreducens]|uniref:Nucleotidyltransferase domain-containing protein n=1 Tax=Desulfosporosinus nitroreducens TaxID=2018668 RepID=A0ABT8QU03_9FIRM|nr:nucleotidyltransferase domain-containing protein [Desulfosporosinus nitroreducens]MDO0824070.1 nucleotidyltransferase domain-containing protein [Desulfosporosinus nitroreducens]
MLTQRYTIDEIKTIVSDIAKRYGVERVVLFGSYARGEDKPGSDIDLRIDKGKIRDLFELSGFKLDLEEYLHLSVDVVETAGLNDKFLNWISKEEILLYEHH